MLKCKRKVKWLMEEITYKYIGKNKEQEKKSNFCSIQIQVQAQQEARSKCILP